VEPEGGVHDSCEGGVLGQPVVVILHYPVTLMISIFGVLEGGNRALLVIHLVKIRY